MFTSDHKAFEPVSDECSVTAPGNLKVRMPDSGRIVAVLNDLMFTVKIQEAGKRAGLEVRFVKSWDKAMDLAEGNPRLIILDLNYSDIKPLDLISALKEKENTKKIPLLGYVAHVQVDMRKAAEVRGCDVVVARSAFVQNLPELLNQVGEERQKELDESASHSSSPKN